MCRGLSTNFSTNIRSSPKLDAASCFERRNPSLPKHKNFENRKPISDLYHLQAYGLNSKMYRNKHNITDLLCLLLDALKILNDNLDIAENSKSINTNNN